MFGVNFFILNFFYFNGVSVVLIFCLCFFGIDRVNVAYVIFIGALIFGLYFFVILIMFGGLG